MTHPSQDDILDVLHAIILPHSSMSIVESGVLSDLSLQQEQDGLHVRFVMEIEPSMAEAMETVRKQAEDVVLRMAGVNRVTALLTAHKAAPQAKTPHADHGADERKLPKGVKHVIAVASGKGGVGKSTVAINLATALARQGLAVGLLDADVYGPSVPRLIGNTQEVEQDGNGLLIPIEAFGMGLISIGFLVPEESPMIWRGPMVHGALKQMLYDVNWGHRDVLILDMPPGTGDAALTIVQQVPLTGAVIVSTPQDIALIDVRKGISMFQKAGVPILGIVENMSYFECPHCHEHTDIFGHDGAKNDAERLDVPFLGHIPLDLALRQMSDAGTPIVAADPDSAQASLFMDMARKLIKEL